MDMRSGFSRQEWDLQGPRLVDLARRYGVDEATVDRLHLRSLDLLSAKGPAELTEAAGEVLDIVTLVLANRLSDSEDLYAEADLDLLRWAASDLARLRAAVAQIAVGHYKAMLPTGRLRDFDSADLDERGDLVVAMVRSSQPLDEPEDFGLLLDHVHTPSPQPARQRGNGNRRKGNRRRGRR